MTTLEVFEDDSATNKQANIRFNRPHGRRIGEEHSSLSQRQKIIPDGKKSPGRRSKLCCPQHCAQWLQIRRNTGLDPKKKNFELYGVSKNSDY